VNVGGKLTDNRQHNINDARLRQLMASASQRES